jgi:thiamine monophosphate kinase
MDAQLLTDYGRSCAHVLARAHARTGDRIAIAGYLGGGDAADIAFTRFAEAYAGQNERDYAALHEAVATGRVAAELDL